VVGHPMQHFAVWFGGSLLASTPDFYNVLPSPSCHPFSVAGTITKHMMFLLRKILCLLYSKMHTSIQKINRQKEGQSRLGLFIGHQAQLDAHILF
jgi:hypothetical protein